MKSATKRNARQPTRSMASPMSPMHTGSKEVMESISARSSMLKIPPVQVTMGLSCLCFRRSVEVVPNGIILPPFQSGCLLR